MRRTLLLASLVLFAGACADAPTAPEQSLAPAPADDVQLASSSQDDSRVIPDQYIVVFDRGVREVPGRARGLTSQAGGELLHVYEHALRGFAARLPEAAVEGIRRNPNVAYIEPDGVMHAIGSGTQSSPPSWGLDRVDERDLPLDLVYDYAASGVGVRAYILDTGIRTSHDDFGPRASVGVDVIGDGQDGQDCNGHGTHVAGTVGGTSYGVAKNAALVAVRVLGCDGSGSYSGVIAGIDWVTANADLPAVANMSLGGGASTAVNEAVDNSVAAGVFYAVAAGNGHWLFGWPEDACTKSPAGAARAYTVGATNSDDGEASFSNYGSCVNLLAPGVSITAPWIGSDTDTNTISGTSMATPHVAGAAAAYLEANPEANPVQVAGALSSGATSGRIALHSSSSSGGTPNLLLYTGVVGDGGGGGGGNAAPTASFTSDCMEFTCDFDGSGSFDDGSIAGYAWDVDGDGTTDYTTESVDDHTYETEGTYTVTLTVTDDLGETGSSSSDVDVGPNSPPNAAFLEACSSLSCAFDGGTYSSDPDGTIVSYAWDYGDGNGETGALVSTTYAEAGTYTVVLTVTDDDGATDQASLDVTLGDGGGENTAPTASFTDDCTDLDCTFDASGSSDSDGSITDYAWDFGDGNSGSGVNPSHGYADGGTYTVVLTVTDDGGATDQESRSVTVASPNQAPTASFTYMPASPETGETISFDGTGSSDSDGTIATYDWDFGDGTTDSGASVTHAYASSGPYTVTLTVTDDDGADGASSQTVTVSEPPSAGITLSANGYKVRGRHTIDLTWTGATSAVDIYRDGSVIAAEEPDDGAYTDATNNRGGGSYTYRVCEAGTDTCSNDATVTF